VKWQSVWCGEKEEIFNDLFDPGFIQDRRKMALKTRPGRDGFASTRAQWGVARKDA
jgi:hypothetical protein